MIQKRLNGERYAASHHTFRRLTYAFSTVKGGIDFRFVAPERPRKGARSPGLGALSVSEMFNLEKSYRESDSLARQCTSHGKCSSSKLCICIA